jgi:caffeoyl-CoA O-methyltransferase
MNKTIHVTPELYDYLLSVSLREPDVLKELRMETEKLPTRNMQIAPEQGQFMAFLVQLTGAKKTLEMGVYTGYSSLATALALPEDGHIIACDLNKEWTSVAKLFWERAGVAHKIDLRLAPAAETLDSLIELNGSDTFDFIFIDADKKNYDIYYEKSLILLRKGGLLLLDNTLWKGKVADQANTESLTEAIRALNKKIYNDKRVSMVVIPMGDGMTLVMKI